MKEKIPDIKYESAKRLKTIRTDMGYSQEMFAEIADISLSAYKKVEGGENNISVAVLRCLKKELGISADYLLFGESKDGGDVWFQIQNCKEDAKMELLLRMIWYFSFDKRQAFSTEEDRLKIESFIKDFMDGKNPNNPNNLEKKYVSYKKGLNK